MAFTPVGVPSEVSPNSMNHSNFYNEVKKDQARLDKLERGSLRSGSIGGTGLRFYDGKVGGDTLATTIRIGSYSGTYWTQDPTTGASGGWNEEDEIRGFALYQRGQSDPWFSAGNVGDAFQFVQIGFVTGQPVDTLLVQANDMWFMSATSDAYLHFSLLGDVTLFAGAHNLNLHSTGGNVDINPGAGGTVYMWNLPTVGAGSNLVLDFSGSGFPQVKYVSSALKYKQDVEDAEILAEEVLLLNGRTWRDKGEVLENPDTDRRFVGFIADELAEIPSMRQFVAFDQNGEPDSIYYDRLTVALLELLKVHEQKINNLEDMVKSIL